MIERIINNVVMKCANDEGYVCTENVSWRGDLRVDLSKEGGKVGAVRAGSGELIQKGAEHHDFIRKRDGHQYAQFHNRFNLFVGDGEEEKKIGFVSISGNSEFFSAAGYVNIPE